ncbi:MAG TPA: hypothetical protein VE622_05250 [Nitrososphaeraceae archaeon]|nr:hypothetical protein [Nitrososphaeraceae archaeon]
MSEENALFEYDSITCKLCKIQFESLGDMQRHMLIEHIQKGDIPSETKEEEQK